MLVLSDRNIDVSFLHLFLKSNKQIIKLHSMNVGNFEWIMCMGFSDQSWHCSVPNSEV